MEVNTEQTEPTTESLTAQLADAQRTLAEAQAALDALEPGYVEARYRRDIAQVPVARLLTELKRRADVEQYGPPLSWQAVAAVLKAGGHCHVSRGSWLSSGFTVRQVDRFRVAISHVGRHVAAEAVAKYAATIAAYGWMARPHDYGLIVSRRYVESEASVVE